MPRRLPWNRAIDALEKDFRRTVEALQAEIADVQSSALRDPDQPEVRLLEANLGGLTERLGVMRAQMDLFPHQVVTVEARLEALEVKVRDQTHAISEGIERTARAERRLGQTVARARKELKEHGFTDPGLDAEAAELRLVDGAGGEGGELPSVREAVAPSEPAASSIPGVTAEQLARIRRL